MELSLGMEGLVGAICFLTLLPPTWQVPFLSLSISLINTMCLPQYPPNASPAQPPTLARLSEVAPNPPHPAGGLGWPHAPPKQLPLWGGQFCIPVYLQQSQLGLTAGHAGASPNCQWACCKHGPTTKGGHTELTWEIILGHLALVTQEDGITGHHRTPSK